jgi:hypothetical protein
VEAATTVARHESVEDVEAWKERGRQMGDQAAIAYAMAAIDRTWDRSRLPGQGGV